MRTTAGSLQRREEFISFFDDSDTKVFELSALLETITLTGKIKEDENENFIHT